MDQNTAHNIIHLVTGEADPAVLKNENILLQLTEYINELIASDFPSLVQMLYRLDIPENILKENLQLNAGEDTARIIAGMIIKRQLQKIELRKKFTHDNDVSNEEKW